MRVGVVSYPGSNGADDAVFAFRQILGLETTVIPHHIEVIRDIDLLVLPGGFSFGDHLRPGALAKQTGIGTAIRRFSKTGKVFGIGNGFQILCEMGLIAGAFLPNPGLTFCSDTVHVRFEGGRSFFASRLAKGTVLRLPLACYHGMFYANGRIRRDYDEQDLVVARYCAEDGAVTEEFYANGSMDGVASLCNTEGNIVGIMTHPERAVEELFGNSDGLTLLRAVTGLVDSAVP